MTNRIDHSGHDHPATTAARQACRKLVAEPGRTFAQNAGVALPNGDQGKAMLPNGEIITRKNRTTPTASSRNLKKPGTHLRGIGDLPDVPRMLAHGARLVWDLGWDVIVGEPFNDEESNIVLMGPVARVTLVWKVTNPHGVWAIWVRRNDSSVAHKVDAIQAAIDAASTEDAWDGKGHIVGL